MGGHSFEHKASSNNEVNFDESVVDKTVSTEATPENEHREREYETRPIENLDTKFEFSNENVGGSNGGEETPKTKFGDVQNDGTDANVSFSENGSDQILGLNGGMMCDVENNGPDSMDVLGSKKVFMTNVCKPIVIEKYTEGKTSDTMEKENMEEVNINLAQQPKTYHVQRMDGVGSYQTVEKSQVEKSQQNDVLDGEANEKRKTNEKRRQSYMSNCKSTLSGKLSMRIIKNKAKNKGKIHSSFSLDRKVVSDVKLKIGNKKEMKKK